MKRRSRGQTLIEVFMASILVALMIFAMVGMYPSAMASLTRSHYITNGGNVATEYTESARTQPFSNIPTYIGAIPSQVVRDSSDNVFYYNDLDLTVLQTDPPSDADGNLEMVTQSWNWDNHMSEVRMDYVYFNPTNPP